MRLVLRSPPPERPVPALIVVALSASAERFWSPVFVPEVLVNFVLSVALSSPASEIVASGKVKPVPLLLVIG